MPAGINHAPDQKPNPVLASENSPGNKPLNSLLMNFAFMPFGRKYEFGKRYQSLPKQTESPGAPNAPTPTMLRGSYIFRGAEYALYMPYMRAKPRSTEPIIQMLTI